MKKRKLDAIDALLLDTEGMREVAAALAFKLDLKNIPASVSRAACLPPSAPMPVEAFDLHQLLRLAEVENERACKAEERADLAVEGFNEIQRLVVAYATSEKHFVKTNTKLDELLRAIQSECRQMSRPTRIPL